MIICTGTLAQGATDYVGQFSIGPDTVVPAPWRVIQLSERVPPTRYRVINWDGVAAVEAVADASMALLARPLEIDIRRTPVLCWRWRVSAPLVNADMATKRGDDYAARVYVAFKLPSDTMSFVTRTQLKLARTLYGESVPDAAINYVWDNRYPVGTRRANAYTSRAQMIVLRSGAQQAGSWVTERRDVLADTTQAFGTDRIEPGLLAIAADTDNTGESTRSGFADLHFVARDVACDFPGRLS
jgi:hypothetical protein